jgi:hypothetical protein
VWSRNLKNEAALARFVENDIRRLGIVSWRVVGRIRIDEDSSKGGVCPSWIVEPHEEEEEESPFGLLRRWECNICTNRRL